MSSDARKKIFLHVGHGKTGSSHLQSCLALSVEALRDAGIAYPIGEDLRNQAISGHVTQGNLPPVSRDAGHDIGQIADLMNSDGANAALGVLFSNEALFHSIMRSDLLSDLQTRFPDHDLEILLFIRNPLDHALSAFQQLLKAGLADDIGTFLAKYNLPQQTKKFLSKVENTGLSVTVINYSKHSRDLVRVLQEWLGVPEGVLVAPPRQSVNRSLSRSEMLVQRAFNRHVGAYARHFIADALSNSLPDVRSDRPAISDSDLEKFIARMKDYVADMNDMIPEAERYEIPDLAEARSSIPACEPVEATLSREQLDVIAESIANYLKPKYVTVKK